MSFPQIDEAHGELIDAVASLTKPGAAPIPVTLVSVSDTPQGQLVVFEGVKWPKDEVVKPLRIAADFLESQEFPNG
ncbi:hypothetical protein [Mameliella sp.]|uniref:hypothetical protein n=1 Tax=Mameliella sp. TaxID=1924940 RepID=UPI003BA848FC